jgi:hypothetical protein
MSDFTKEGRRVQATTCPVAFSGRHEADQVQAQLGTFTCRLCGVVPKDSDVYHEDMMYLAMQRSSPLDSVIVEEKKTVDCPGCGGTGYSEKTKRTCTGCKGTGKITVDI